jgi:methyltransferase (TIGR00027 family)
MSDPPRTPVSDAIENVSDTALWVAMYRALESERKDAHFHDPYARRLAGPRGEAILGKLRGRAMSWPMVVRTCTFDEILMRLVREQALAGVLNLAAGLDARPWRLPLPPSLSWVDVDLPAMLEHKRAIMATETAACRYRAEALDLRDRAARRARLPALVAGASPALVMSEGLLIYLSPDQVGELADDLHAILELRWWLIDLASPALLRWLSRRLTTVNASAPFRFGPAEGTRFFAAHGWREVEFRSTWEEGRRLKREMPFAWFWRLLSRFARPGQREVYRRFSGTVLLERA